MVVKKLDTASNYVQLIEILESYPSIAILDDSSAEGILNQIMLKYHINELHYYWSSFDASIINCTRMRLRDLPAYYEKTLSTMFFGNAYLIIDPCCGGRFIICQNNLAEFITLLKENYYELVEIYILDDSLNIRLCINHVCEAFEFE